MLVTKTIRAHAIIDQETKYEVDEATWKKLVDEECYSEEVALEVLLENDSTKCISTEIEVVDVTLVHEKSIEA
jgi:hypothetical protein